MNVPLDKEHLKLLSRIESAHFDLINNCTAKNDLIATASNDGKVKIWDTKKLEKSQSCIYEDLSQRPTCVRFFEDHFVLIGNQSGEIQLIDMRKPKECLRKNSTLKNLVTRINFSPQEKNLAGVCTESNQIGIFSLDNNDIELK